MITAENIYSHEFIGMNAEIVQSSNPQIIGLNGRINNETKSMFTISTNKGVKSIPKAQSHWKFTLENKDTVIVDGTKIAKRPFDRIGAKA